MSYCSGVSEPHVTWWVVIWFLWSAKSYLLNITCGLDCVTLDDSVLHRCVSGGSGWRPRTGQQLVCHCTSWDTSTRSIATGHRVSLCLTGVCESPETAVGHWCSQLVCSGSFCVNEESNSAIYFWHLYLFQEIVRAENKLQNYKNLCGVQFWNLTLRGLCIVIYSCNKSQPDALFLNFILVKNSTCFGQIYSPLSGVLILYSQQLVFVILVMLTVG
jgi:hypothetical protein